MTAKEYLRSFARRKIDTEVLEERIGELKQRKTQLRAVKHSGLPRAKKQMDLSDAEAAIDSLIREYEQDITRRMREESRIRERIDKMPDPEERKVLRLVYILDKKLTWYEIAEEMSVSKRTAQNIYGRALQHFGMP